LNYQQSVNHSGEISAPFEAVWELLIDWAGIINWMPDGHIQSLRCEGQGEGAVRHLVTGKGVPISEKLDGVDRKNGILRLSIIAPLPWGMLSYSAQAHLKENGAHCHLKWRGTFELTESDQQADELSKLLKMSYETMFKGIRNELQRMNKGNHGE
jgi:hypothetical protein